MKHVLGMAKRHLDLNGAKGPKTELDYLRLVYVTKELRRTGHEAQGYLLVMTDAIERRADNAWRDKYQAGDCVEVIVAQLTEEESQGVMAEVQANRDGMLAGTLGEDVDGRSDASVGGQVGEDQLAAHIGRAEVGVVRCEDERRFPFGIRWDYSGIIES